MKMLDIKNWLHRIPNLQIKVDKKVYKLNFVPHSLVVSSSMVNNILQETITDVAKKMIKNGVKVQFSNKKVKKFGFGKFVENR